MNAANPQLNDHGELIHLLSLDGLPREILHGILDRAEPFTAVAEREVKKVPLLRGKSVFNLFFENSTRTRTTFEIAAKRLSADVINLNINTSSTAKGETLLDTVDNLVAMQADMFVVRHAASGAPYLIAQHLAATKRHHIHVVNAGDGRHAHPTQGLLDMYTIRHYKRDFTQLTVAVVGDILHSRVARSQLHALATLGVPEIRLVGPKTLLPTHAAQMIDNAPLRVCHDINEGLRLARKLLLEVNEIGLPCATEFLDLVSPQYIADLISWSAIGARTTESQTHRQMASGLSMPLGFKNATPGAIDPAIHAIKAARQVIGATNPLEAAPGSIRGDFAIEVGTNLVHGSDSPEAGEREAGIFFG